MISKEEAQNKVYETVCKGWKNDEFPENELIIIESETIDKEAFWVFFYTSKLWHETGDMQYAIAGNAPLIVNKTTGEIKVTGTAHSIEKYIEKYERQIKNTLQH